MSQIDPQPDGRPDGRASSAIANLIVRLFSEHAGRGPTRARAYVQDDIINVVLRDTLTRGEQGLVQEGHSQQVLEMRRLYQDTMRADAISGVEKLTGRRVAAFLSSNHIDPDVAVETFLLEPRSGRPAFVE